MNTHGGKGRNLPCYLQHVNRLYKQLIANMGALAQTGIHPEATDHSRKSDATDVQIVVEVVLKARIYLR